MRAIHRTYNPKFGIFRSNLENQEDTSSENIDFYSKPIKSNARFIETSADKHPICLEWGTVHFLIRREINRPLLR